ncbi:hypothetical protein [Actinoplanes friuliensis]|uniref:hypothetical protein n=1 Tax=Actinoplanes friuliensis TaxID=196914 RepID=UPI00041C679B|nr:hypothetical protein [Actinoplanes friuliensis]
MRSYESRMQRELLDSGIPVAGLAPDGVPGAAVFAGMERSDDCVVCVSIVYEDAGPFVTVDTARWTGIRVATPVREVLEECLRGHGDRLSAVSWTEDATTMILDGAELDARIVRAGDRWWAARCEREGVEFTVVARDWDPGRVRLETVADLLPVLSRPRMPSVRPQPRPAGIPGELTREPHRELVDASLRFGRAQAEWRRDGGPVPELPAYWRSLWQAAVRRQSDLTDQPVPVAEHAVSDIVAHLANLQQQAAWFRNDDERRERAITETLLHGTGLSDRVPSRAAQLAWQARRGAILDAGALAERSWLAAWEAWARR